MKLKSPRLNEPHLRRIIRVESDATDDTQLGFQRAVQAVMKETGMSGVEARWLVMRLRGDDPISGAR